jgi:hypothetical protein
LLALTKELYYTKSVTIKSLKGGVRKGMDFSNRSTQPQNVAPGNHVTSPTAPAASSKRGGQSEKSKWIQLSTYVLFAAAIIILIGLIAVIAFGGNDNESKYVDSGKLQAVFLETGQVYFGNIQNLNSNYFRLTNIYYLQTSSSSTTTTSAAANTSVSLVKLGCELHEPYDQMIINRTQITFWENLQSDGQVAKAVASFEKANPNGQKCTDQSSASSTTGSTVQNAGTATEGTTKQ